MKGFVPLQWSLIKLFISLVMVIINHKCKKANALERDEIKRQTVQYNTSFQNEKKSLHRLKPWTKHSTKRKINRPAKRLFIDISRTENDTSLDGTHGNYFKNDVRRTTEQNFKFVSSVKSFIYNFKNRERMRKDKSMRVRKDVETKSQNMTRQTVQCEVASLSCRNCCENSNNCSHKTKFCRCDPQCTFYHDCCVDHETFCGKKQQVSFGVAHQGLSCMKPTHVDRRNYPDGIWLINKCPRKSDENSRECEIADSLTLKLSNLQNLIPVVDKNNLIYRNEFCAKCNGIEQFEYFGFQMLCYIVPPASITTFPELVEFASKHCEKWISIYQEQSQTIRECNQYFRHLCPTLKELNEKCSPLYEENCTVRTHWCNLNTSRWDNEAELKCSGGSRGGAGADGVLPPFIAVLRFPKGPRGPQVQETKRYCGDKFYDEYLETCRVGQSMPPVKENLDKYLIAIWFDFNNAADRLATANEIISSLAELFNFEQSQASEFRYTTVYHRVKTMAVLFKLVLSNEQTLRLAKTNYTAINDTVSYFGNSSRNLTNGLPLQRLLFFSGKFNITILNETFTVFKTTSRQLACIRKQTYTQDTYTSMQNGEYYINSTGKTFEKTQVFFEDSMPNKSISVCEQIVFSTCTGRRVLLTAKEYVKFGNLSIFYNRTKTIYHFGEYDIQNGKIFMCIQQETPTSFLVNVSKSSVIQTYITLVCFALSLVCLFLVIQTYVLFRELRNLPGKNVLSLAVSLFLAQLLWLIQNRLYTPTICRVIAAIGHYLFLVSFVAMATIAWDTHSVFARKDVPNEVSKKREIKKFYKYSAIVWGLPAVFVATCALVDQQDIYAVYVNERLCFFDNAQAQTYLFVVPVGLLLLFNVIFFVLTVIHIQLAHSSTRLVHSDQRHRTMFWIYLKLSALMGFSWFFGFIDLFAESTIVFSYLFVIFASLQGVYIAIAFVMKIEIWEKYKKLFERNDVNIKPDHRSTLLESLSKETRL